MRNVIFIKEIGCECIIGIEDWERQVRQKVLVSLEIPYSWQESAVSDSLEGAVDYKALTKGVVRLVNESRFNLIEALAEAVAQFCLGEFRLSWVRVELSKPGAFSNAKTVGIRILRTAAPPQKPGLK